MKPGLCAACESPLSRPSLTGLHVGHMHVAEGLTSRMRVHLLWALKALDTLLKTEMQWAKLV